MQNRDPERLEKIRILMVRGQRVKATKDAADKEWGVICNEASHLGINLNVRGEVQPTQSYVKHGKQLINHMKLSKKLAGGLRNITKQNVPQKYAEDVFQLYEIVGRWYDNRQNKLMQRRKVVRDRLMKSMKEIERIAIIDKKKLRKW